MSTVETFLPVRVRLDDSFELPIGRTDAFRLFTARGEREWADGWDPEFFGTVDDDAEVGTVFRTGTPPLQTTWIVVDSEPGERIRYARVDSRGGAGTVAVALDDTSDGCRVTVAYDLTSTTPAAAAQLAEFAHGYSAYIASWRVEILDRVVRAR